MTEPRSDLRTLVCDHRFAAFLAITFAVTWGLWGAVLALEVPQRVLVQAVGGLGPLIGAATDSVFPPRFRATSMDTDASVDVEALVAAAREATDRAYVPYSEYRVGAALLADDGSVHTGANLENANYSNSLHAEEVAVARALMDGHRAFEALAVSSGERDGVTPCGMCRQTLAEFCEDDLPIYCDEGDGENGPEIAAYALGELIPATISRETLGR